MRKYKYFLSFESFTGEIHYFPNHPENSRLTLNIEAKSISCRNRRLRYNKQRHIAKYLRNLDRDAATHSLIQFSSRQVSVKPLRGLVVEGMLTVRGTACPFNLNTVIVPGSADRLEVEADSMFRLSDFGIKAPSSFFGLAKISDQALAQFRLNATRAVKENQPSDAARRS
jgi:polyisoprenoid-binding protein YceI